jgi:shikimate kinase
MPSVRNVILIGYRACGKTTVGAALAERLGWTFVDTDQIIQARTKRSIRAIFTHDGEAAFRDHEAAAVTAVTTGRNQVISVGGGAILRLENRERLRAAGYCCWLTAPPEVLYERIAADQQSAANRPPLTPAGGTLAEVERVLTERAALYAATSHSEIDVSPLTVDQVVAAILARLADHEASPSS